MANLTPDVIAAVLPPPSEAGYVALRDSIAQEAENSMTEQATVTDNYKLQEIDQACRLLARASDGARGSTALPFPHSLEGSRYTQLHVTDTD
jgi:hypothetical protein